MGGEKRRGNKKRHTSQRLAHGGQWERRVPSSDNINRDSGVTSSMRGRLKRHWTLFQSRFSHDRWQGYCRRRWPTSASKKQRQSTGPSSTRIHAPVVACVQSPAFATSANHWKVTPSTLKYMALVHKRSSSSWGSPKH